MVDFPNDDDGDVLRSLFKKGVDLSLPRNIDFYCYVSDMSQAKQVAVKTRALGFEPDIYQDEVSSKISVYNVKKMIPTYHNVIETQSILNALLKEFGTVCDGWGTLSNGTE